MRGLDGFVEISHSASLSILVGERCAKIVHAHGSMRVVWRDVQDLSHDINSTSDVTDLLRHGMSFRESDSVVT